MSDGFWTFLNPLQDNGNNSFGQVAVRFLNLLLFIAGILAVFYLVWAGLQYITAGGDTAKAGTARTGIVNAIIGIIVILLSALIVRWVSNAAMGSLQ